MRIILDQGEIELAITQYVLGKISKNETQKIQIELAAGRGPSGFRATINITDTVVEIAPKAPRTPKVAVAAPPIPATPVASLVPPVASVSSRSRLVEAADPVEEAPLVSADPPPEVHKAVEGRAEAKPAAAVSTGTGTAAGKSSKRPLFKGLVRPGTA